MSVADGERIENGPTLPDAPALPSRQNIVPYREWSDHWGTQDGGDLTEAAPTAPAPPIVDIADTRPLPALAADDWWLEPPDPAGGGDAYLDFPHADPPRRRAWLVLVGVLLGLAALAAIPMFGDTADRSHTGPAKAGPSAGTPTDDLISPGSLAPAVGQTGQTALSAATASAGPGTTNRPPTPAFAPLTLRADTAQINRPARAIPYPGATDGSIVTNIGTWKHDNGSIQFTNVAIPASGTYVITVYYVNLADPTTSAEIAVSDVSPVMQTFTGSAVCCASIAIPPITIGAGIHTITIGNQNGPGPSIDKIVIVLM